MENLVEKLMEWITLNGINILVAVVILVVGRWVAKLIEGIIKKILTARKVDGTIVSFVASMAYIALMAFVIIAALSKVGIQTTSFIAVLGAAGLAIGLALQGSLANFASGFLMIIFRPFKEGDYIEAGGTAGIVKDMQIFTTTLTTPDNKRVIIPNSKITGDNIINYTATGTRRIDLTVGVSYSDDIDKVRRVLQGIIDSDDRILKDPAPMLPVSAMADSSINFIVRVWVNVSDYWSVFFDTTEAVKKRFDQEGITIPFPQSDVHLYEHKE
ncbi:MAG: mechanosensitive ion channel [Sedimentisphaerales bacterium]|nr:mechanosensitive ion channel [Sedimentisphaerales bacterium]